METEFRQRSAANCPEANSGSSDQPISWWESLQKTLRRFCGSVLRTGSVPEHLAIIMDGNRRFATSKQLAQHEGHAFGYRKVGVLVRLSGHYQ